MSGRYPVCRECVGAYNRQWREANPEHVARYQAAKRAQYAAGLEPLERKCMNPDCGKTFTPSRRDAKTCSKACRDRVRYLKRKSAA
jgi:ferric-dicitrate binding protein FerR (iron transport regulator)